MVQVTGCKWEEVRGEADVNKAYLVAMWPQSTHSCLTWQLREIFILLLKEGVTERCRLLHCSLWWEHRNTPHLPDQGAYLGCLHSGASSGLFKANWFCLYWRQGARHEVTPALVHTLVPFWEGTTWSSYHKRAVEGAVWTVRGARSWDSITREGTQFNQPALDDSGRAWESRNQILIPGQCPRGNHHGMAWPHQWCQGAEFGAPEQPLNFLVLQSWKKPF